MAERSIKLVVLDRVVSDLKSLKESVISKKGASPAAVIIDAYMLGALAALKLCNEHPNSRVEILAEVINTGAQMGWIYKS